jgi:Holliday junction resolvase-like predicted endonuclease
MHEKSMLTENDIINFVIHYLKNNGYNILKKSKTNEKGIDIVAVHPDKGKCFVEAKGETSSKKGTKKYGKPFNKSQIRDHIGSALLQTLKIKQEDGNSDVFIAVPFEKNHIEIFESIKECLFQIKINFLFVKCDGSIVKNK